MSKYIIKVIALTIATAMVSAVVIPLCNFESYVLRTYTSADEFSVGFCSCATCLLIILVIDRLLTLWYARRGDLKE